MRAALYRGQLILAQHAKTREMLVQACHEETDHLAWTDTRLRALGGHRSYLNGFWYINSFFMGVLAAKIGDPWSLGLLKKQKRRLLSI